MIGRYRGDRRGGRTGIVAVDGFGRGRGTRDGVLTLWTDGRGGPPGPNP